VAHMVKAEVKVFRSSSDAMEMLVYITSRSHDGGTLNLIISPATRGKRNVFHGRIRHTYMHVGHVSVDKLCGE
jgi:hypothetical protein